MPAYCSFCSSSTAGAGRWISSSMRFLFDDAPAVGHQVQRALIAVEVDPGLHLAERIMDREAVRRRRPRDPGRVRVADHEDQGPGRSRRLLEARQPDPEEVGEEGG